MDKIKVQKHKELLKARKEIRRLLNAGNFDLAEQLMIGQGVRFEYFGFDLPSDFTNLRLAARKQYAPVYPSGMWAYNIRQVASQEPTWLKAISFSGDYQTLPNSILHYQVVIMTSGGILFTVKYLTPEWIKKLINSSYFLFQPLGGCTKIGWKYVPIKRIMTIHASDSEVKWLKSKWAKLHELSPQKTSEFWERLDLFLSKIAKDTYPDLANKKLLNPKSHYERLSEQQIQHKLITDQ